MPAPRIPTDFSLVALDEVASTNDEAKRLAGEGAAAGTTVWARSQSGGRGRRGRHWVSPPGNLYVSVVLRSSCAPIVGAQVSFVAALAIAETVARLLPPEICTRCKWPNDVLVGGRKVSGILLESATTTDAGETTIDWLVLGVGVNVAHHPGIGGPQPSVSLHEAGASDATVESVLEAYLESLSQWQETWEKEGFSGIREAWLARSFPPGHKIQANLPQETVIGTFGGLDETGALLLVTPEGTERAITAGDVFFGAEGTGNAAGD